MKLIIDIPEEVCKRIKFYREFRDLNDNVNTLKAIDNAVPLDDVKAELKARLWRWRGKDSLNIDKVAMETIINEVLDKENA